MKKYFKLNNGLQIPSIGFGTWQTPDGSTAIDAVKTALAAGYRHIDTAAIYKNEESVGKGIKESGIEREEVFVTSKLWNSERGYEKTMRAFDKSLNDLQLDYLDMYLIHWPAVENQYKDWQKINAETWRALEELNKQGRIKTIGVSNFLTHHLKPLLESATLTPSVNQIEYHPGFMQQDIVELCRKNNIVVEAWSPLGTGKMLNNETLITIAKKYKVSVAQLCIRWVLQNDVLPLPKSASPHRIKENIQIDHFEIAPEDMQTINNMDYFGGSGMNPDTINF
ncbi:Aldo/keto reductase [Saccharicrinis carchari]|uniref:Aldo/keto reductase n=1 Tax=Saccharicrinis carchari TaxID=1168039 RepID=A0A521DU21_SACCC|nr:aldo/keto reductase [Saccharicrinis carchari]SMO75197.1 Aldo/keto reductase [Saccharicrinis carchari]